MADADADPTQRQVLQATSAIVAAVAAAWAASGHSDTPETFAQLVTAVEGVVQDSKLLVAVSDHLETLDTQSTAVPMVKSVVDGAVMRRVGAVCTRIQQSMADDEANFPLADSEDIYGYDDFDSAEKLVEYIREECGEDINKLARYKSYVARYFDDEPEHPYLAAVNAMTL